MSKTTEPLYMRGYEHIVSAYSEKYLSKGCLTPQIRLKIQPCSTEPEGFLQRFTYAVSSHCEGTDLI